MRSVFFRGFCLRKQCHVPTRSAFPAGWCEEEAGLDCYHGIQLPEENQWKCGGLEPQMSQTLVKWRLGKSVVQGIKKHQTYPSNPSSGLTLWDGWPMVTMWRNWWNLNKSMSNMFFRCCSGDGSDPRSRQSLTGALQGPMEASVEAGQMGTD